MKSYKIFAAVLLPILFTSCGSKARIDCLVENAPERDVIVKLLDVSDYKILDTVRTDTEGRLSYSLPVEKGQPEFVYLFYGDNKIASLLLESGDKVSVKTDTLGHCSVENSEESAKLVDVDKSLSAFLYGIQSLSANSEVPDEEIRKFFVNYYRDRVKFVMENCNSMTAIPVLYQKFDNNSPLFFQSSDAIIFRQVYDSLSLKYPDSRYVTALGKEVERRLRILDLDNKISSAGQCSYPDIVADNVQGGKETLSKVESKVILLHFWSPEDAAQKMMNLEVLKPLYDTYKGRGLQIFSVAVTSNKSLWASVVNAQKLPWINVCDVNGTQSVRNYNIGSLPVTILIHNGEIHKARISGSADLENVLSKLL